LTRPTTRSRGTSANAFVSAALSHVSSVDCVAQDARFKTRRRKEGNFQRLLRDEGGTPAARECSFLANNRTHERCARTTLSM
jgi:hypothetical protein